MTSKSLLIMTTEQVDPGWIDQSCDEMALTICRDVQQNCWGAMGLEEGTIKDNQMHGSTYIDSDHHGRAARLNGPHSWTPDPLKDVHGNAPYLIINLVSSGSSRNAGYKIHGISTQGK